MFDDLFGETYRTDSPTKRKKPGMSGFYEQPYKIGKMIS
jgi:hypothetical protein